MVHPEPAAQKPSWFRSVTILTSLLFGGLIVGQSMATDITLNIPYGPKPSQMLDVYHPSASPGKAHAVVLIHGGGWATGDKRDYRSIGRHAAARGIVAVAINYRLADGSRENMWPGQLDDAQAALRWVADHAHELGVDPDLICVSGNSAGGQLAALLAVARMAALPRIACVVDEFGPVDLVKFFQQPPANLFGSANPDVVRTVMEKASPVNLVTAGTPPTLILQGSEDTVVRPDQSEALHAALARAGVETRYVSFRGGHAFKGLSTAQYVALQDLELDFVTETRPR